MEDCVFTMGTGIEPEKAKGCHFGKVAMLIKWINCFTGLDFATMTLMDHSIISHGDFSFWTAFLRKNEGTTLFPARDFYGPRQIKALNSYGSNWIRSSDP